MNFDLPKDQSSIIKVIGVGGGGSNAVNHMYQLGIKGVDFIVCNTDSQALDVSPVPVKVQLGQSLTEGRGAGSIPAVGKNAAIENIDEIQEILAKQTTMVFVTAGMGGGTGTGAAPVIAKAAKDMGILTVGIVTIPFTFEGRKRMNQAAEGLREMRACVDTLLVIRNDKLREMHGNLSLQNAFEQADNILANAAKGIAELISVTGAINVDMNDVNTVMKDSGVAVMGQASAEGEDRAIKAARKALESPLLNDNDIEGAQYILLNITYGSSEVMMDEISDITDYIQQAAGSSADVIWGHGLDETLGEKLSVTIIATGFKTTPDTGFELEEPVRMNLNSDAEPKKSRAINAEMDSPVGDSASEPYLKEVSKEELEEKEKHTAEQPVQRFDLFGNEAPQTQQAKEEKNQVENEEEEKTPEKHEYYRLDDKEEVASKAQSSDDEDDTADISHRVNVEVANQLNRERLRNLREISERIKSPQGLNELEKEPAYKRRNVQLDRLAHSSDSEVSRYTLSEERDENGKTRSGLRPNNPYLHDNVD
ncbi:cell division protein FtsZ [Cryomorpha ignava]|uniref:Cell division protein FtsZ n=1 Tax=Cryomorpha ignava TaxID=101383 RepID=A0A7K3WMV1_9FLAO|nr:cell division protein FtsZ [Cryomorpha ignava]NEN22983.1 cell division protein FtsZ [Cryomorpha ignava]